MEKEFVNYEQAIALKELGFNEKCFAIWFEIDNKLIIVTPDQNEDCYYDFNGTDLEINAPLKQQVFRWFRENYSRLYVDLFVDDDKTFGYAISYFVPEGRVDKPYKRQFISYEEAENACIDQLILIGKQQNNGKRNNSLRDILWS